MREPISLGSGHLDTIIPYYLRPTPKVAFDRERIETPDNDFLDLDWIKQHSKKVVILTHGFESNSNAKYIKGMAKTFKQAGYDILAWNFRSCSEEMNYQPIFYHSGATYDLNTVIQHTLHQNYDEIYLIGFSMGGNLTLKYLGENTSKIPYQIKKSCVFSVPCSLLSSSRTLEKGLSKQYSAMFLKSLKAKVKKKKEQLESHGINCKEVLSLKTLIEFDHKVTAPLHGFKDAFDYYEQSSANKYIPEIKISTLIVNAQNDPFLGEECYPTELVDQNANVSIKIPRFGGHVGFVNKFPTFPPWSEEMALRFFNSN